MLDDFLSKEIIETRICQTCGIEKPLKSFTHKNKNKKPCYSNNCFACKSKITQRNKGIAPRKLPFYSESLQLMVRECKKCGEIKPLDDFPVERIKNDKTYYQGRCFGCRDIYQKKWFQENFERIQKRNKARLEAMSGEDKHIQSLKQYIWKRTYWDKKTPEQRAKHYEKHRNLQRKSGMTYRARKLNCPFIEPFSVSDIIKRDGLNCYLCKKTLTENEATIDHVLPLTRGGHHTSENAKIACRSCNSAKNNKRGF